MDEKQLILHNIGSLIFYIRGEEQTFCAPGVAKSLRRRQSSTNQSANYFSLSLTTDILSEKL